MLQDVQRRIDKAIATHEAKPHGGAAAPPPSGGVSQEEFNRLQEQVRRQQQEQENLRRAVETLQRLAREFSDTLAQLGTDVDQLKRDLAALAARVGKVEEAIAKMPKIT